MQTYLLFYHARYISGEKYPGSIIYGTENIIKDIPTLTLIEDELVQLINTKKLSPNGEPINLVTILSFSKFEEIGEDNCTSI